MSNSKHWSAKERIEYLLDENSFVEIGALVTRRNTDFNLSSNEVPADGVITGYGVIDCNPVYVYSQDVSALNGTIGEMHAKKIANLYDMAIKVGAPIIGILDCGGLRLQEATDALAGLGSIYTKQIEASGVIPQITAVVGNCGGGEALVNALSDFTYMLKDDAKLYVNAPNTLEGNHSSKNDTAAADFQAEAGNVDFVCENEEELFSSIRELVTFIPTNNEDDASYDECTDDLNRFNDVNGTKDALKILEGISDDGRVIEVKADYAKSMVTAFIRLNGMTVGAVANRSEIVTEEGTKELETTMTANGCYKAERFVKICDAFNIPILTLTATTGFRNTVCGEKRVAVSASRMMYAFGEATVPKINVVIGNSYGSAYVAMNSKHIGADMVFAWPNIEISTMEADMAAKIMYADEKDVNVINEKADEYRNLQASTESAAKRGYVDAIINPEVTRKNLIYAYEMLFTKREDRISKKHGTV